MHNFIIPWTYCMFVDKLISPRLWFAELV